MSYNIMIARKKKKLTQDKLCEVLGISRRTLSNIENGKDESVTKKMMFKFANALETDVQTLFFSEE